MKLVQLDDGNIKNLRGKKIFLAGKDISYIEEFLNQYMGWEESIAGVIDSYSSNDEICVNGKTFTVFTPWVLEQYDMTKIIILITEDYYVEYYRMLKSMFKKMVPRDYEIYFFANTETQYTLQYKEKYKERPLQDIILFRSGPHAKAYVEGMDFFDNAKAVFEYALKIKLNKKYKLIWMVKHKNLYKDYEKMENVSFIEYDWSVSTERQKRDTYYGVLFQAKVIFFTDAYGFARNCFKNQIRVQLWHGSGYKKRLSTAPCEKRYEYMTVPSPLYARLHAREFGLKSSQMLVTGNAKTDWLFQREENILQKLGIPYAAKYIFWLPTYRFSPSKMHKPVDGILEKETGMPLLETIEQVDRINAELKQRDCVLVIKLHPFQDREALKIKNFSNIWILENDKLVKYGVQINQVLAFADALISDYSSAIVDFLVLNRPIALAVKDVAEYSDKRGYIFNDLRLWLPGSLITTEKELTEFISDVAEQRDTTMVQRNKIRKKMHMYCDAQSSKRILETLRLI